MPPKVKITKENIVKAALDLLRLGGEEALNARGLAAALGCSTQPLFSNFATMEDLQTAMTTAAHEHYLGFLQREVDGGKYPPYKAFGMAYIRFAKEESALFKHLFMCDRHGEAPSPSSDFETSVKMIMSTNGIDRQTAERMHMEMWAFVHGIATMLATNFLEPAWEQISEMLTDVYQGLRTRHISEE